MSKPSELVQRTLDVLLLKIYRWRRSRCAPAGVSSLVHADMLDLAPAAAGNKLVVAAGRGRETRAAQRLVVIDLETGARRDLTAPDVAAQGPAWSPDGCRIAYFAAVDAELAEAR